MNDQMIGGLIMWIPGGLFFYTIISIVFFRWQQRDGVESQSAAQVDWRRVCSRRLSAPAVEPEREAYELGIAGNDRLTGRFAKRPSSLQTSHAA